MDQQESFLDRDALLPNGTNAAGGPGAREIFLYGGEIQPKGKIQQYERCSGGILAPGQTVRGVGGRVKLFAQGRQLLCVAESQGRKSQRDRQRRKASGPFAQKSSACHAAHSLPSSGPSC